MATVDVVTAGNKKAGSVDLDPSIFEAPVRRHLFHAEVRRQLAKRRRGTHSTKNRAAVSGGGIKPWKQKGTGRARQGTIRAPQWAGGGVVFGPVPRILRARAAEEGAPRGAAAARSRSSIARGKHHGRRCARARRSTRRSGCSQLLRDLELADARVLIVIAAEDPFVERSARNLRNVSVLRVDGLNVYDVLRHGKLLLTQAAVAAIGERLRRRPAGRRRREPA